MARPPSGWHPEDIKAALKKRHGTIRALSMRWGYDHRAISNALRDPRYSRPLEKLIASELGVKPHILWPARWSADGSPVPRDGEARVITTTSQKSCLKGEAA